MARLGAQFLRFAAVGGIGFLVDALALYALVKMGGAPLLMRLFSFALAVTVTWALNRVWTFAKTARTPRQEYAAYVSVQAVGVAINYAVYALVLSVLTPSAAHAVLALACGSAVALMGNFIGARSFVYRDLRG
ncbi:hypothetical protein A3731_12790 [Roseovarius sp. HI0049]|nr:hypothetical protein A3731_12790 [Roseovarius sp. HI0049]